MSYNGSGTFNINTTGQPVVAGTVITATAFNLLTADLATGLTTAMTKDGQTTTTARIPFAQGINSTLVTDSTNTTSGSIITAGGVGIAKALYVGTTANVTGVATFSAQPIFSSLTASSAVATDASKGLVSVTNTGTGNNVLATAPTIASLNLTTALTIASAAGTAGQALVSGGSGNAPTWATASSDTVGFKNRIFNGQMVIDQRNAGASVTPTVDGYASCDRWNYSISQSSKFSTQRSTTAPTGFSNSTLLTSLSAYSVTANDYFTFNQMIEGFNFADMMWGTASAQTVTLSFWVRSSLTGTFGGALSNSIYNRCYPFSYSISSANTWEQKSITIAGDTTGTWVGATNGIGVVVQFSIGASGNSLGTAGAWVGSYKASATGATNVVGTNGATFYITGVQLEKGSTATSFDYRPYGTELALCQRYYWKQTGEFGVNSLGAGFCNATTKARINIQNPVQMRTAPTYSYSGTLLLLNAVASGVTVTSLSSTQAGLLSSMIEFTASGGGLVGGDGTLVLADNATSNFIQASAEL